LGNVDRDVDVGVAPEEWARLTSVLRRGAPSWYRLTVTFSRLRFVEDLDLDAAWRKVLADAWSDDLTDILRLNDFKLTWKKWKADLEGDRSGIYTVNVDGTDLHQVTAVEDPQTPDWGPAPA
jgi:hypothetical protein